MTARPPAKLPAPPVDDRARAERPEMGRWPLEDGVCVAVDGSRIRDADHGRSLPAVVVTLAPYAARHLAALLDDWTTIAGLLESARGSDERELARALYEAARAADALRSEVGVTDGADRDPPARAAAELDAAGMDAAGMDAAGTDAADLDGADLDG